MSPDIDISLEELRRRQRQRSSTPKSERRRCPECESTDIIRKVGSMGGTPPDHATEYRCGYCQHHFDTPLAPEEGER